MASVLHGSARTTPRIRAELQASKESSRALAAAYGLNAEDGREMAQEGATTADAPMGPKAARSSVLTPAEEAVVVAFRQKTLLPLDDVLGCLMDTIPNLSRSALHYARITPWGQATFRQRGLRRPGLRRTRSRGLRLELWQLRSVGEVTAANIPKQRRSTRDGR